MICRNFHLLAGFVIYSIFTGCNTGSSRNPVTPQVDSSIHFITENLPPGDIAAYEEKLRTLFDSGLRPGSFNGGILVAKGGNILYEKYLGFKNPRVHTDSIDASTTFHLASTSKPFTGVAILKLVQAGRLGLEDDLTKFFPSFPYQGVTVRMLLSHRSGLPNYLYFMEDKAKWPHDKMVSNQDVLNFLIKYKPGLERRSGSGFGYSNTNYVLLALIAEKITGKKFPQYLKETIFTPLHMTRTFVYTPADSGKVIMSYKPSGAVWPNDIYENTYGDKNVYSTPRDLMKWDQGLYDGKFISQSLLDSAFLPQSHEHQSIHNYGLGWRMLNFKNGKNLIYHFGKWHGFTPAFARMIDEKAVVIILGNKFNRNIYETAKKSYTIFGNYSVNGNANGVDEEEATAAGPEEKIAALPVKPRVSRPAPTVKAKAHRHKQTHQAKQTHQTKRTQHTKQTQQTRQKSTIKKNHLSSSSGTVSKKKNHK
jgi:CubicO group peptidase (beta-lactamase class C family)